MVEALSPRASRNQQRTLGAAIMKVDYYELLEISKTANGDEIKRAYRRLAVKYHPDHNPEDAGAEDKFKSLTEAYAVLSDADKRRRYDQLGPGAFGGGHGAEPVDFGSIGEILEGLLGDVLGKRDANLPRDLRYDLEISFEEAALGAEKMITVERPQPCPPCNGSGAEAGTRTETCPACNGRGSVKFQRGFFASARPCSTCDGRGTRIDTPCRNCGGRGRAVIPETLSVKIPPGVDDGAVRTLSGAGERTPKGSGNLLIHIKVRPHSLFRRDGADILCDVPLSFPQAALGAQVDAPTLEGRVKLKIPPGTQSGKVFRLRGKGLPVFGGYGKGDQLVKVLVEVPEQLNDRQRELLQALAAEMDDTSHPQQRGFLDKLKDLLD